MSWTCRGRVSVGESPLKGQSTGLSQPDPPVRPLKEKKMSVSTSNPGSKCSQGVLEVAPNVSARGARSGTVQSAWQVPPVKRKRREDRASRKGKW